MIKLKSLIKEWTDTSFKDLPKRWTSAYGRKDGLTEFEAQGGKDILKEYKYGGIINMKDQMKLGKFNPENPDIHISGWGVLPLKSLHRLIAKDLKEISSEISTISDRTAKNTEYRLYSRHAPLEHKIKALNEAYKQINSSQYKRAITMWKRKR